MCNNSTNTHARAFVNILVLQSSFSFGDPEWPAALCRKIIAGIERAIAEQMMMPIEENNPMDLKAHLTNGSNNHACTHRTYLTCNACQPSDPAAAASSGAAMVAAPGAPFPAPLAAGGAMNCSQRFTKGSYRSTCWRVHSTDHTHRSLSAEPPDGKGG